MFPFNHGWFSETPQWNLQPTSTRVSAGTEACCWVPTQRCSTCKSMRSFTVSASATSYHDSSRQLSSESAKGQADVCISICSWIVKPFYFVVLIGMDMNYAYDKLDHSNSLAFSSLIFLSLTIRLCCVWIVSSFSLKKRTLAAEFHPSLPKAKDYSINGLCLVAESYIYWWEIGLINVITQILKGHLKLLCPSI